MSERSILLVTPYSDDNALGRTFAKTMVLDALGWNYRVVAMTGKTLWSPISSEPFAKNLLLYSRLTVSERDALWRWPDVVWCTKPLPESFGAALRSMGEQGRARIIVDIDDPDIDVRIGPPGTLRRLRRMSRSPRLTSRLRRMEVELTKVRRSVSNPVLMSQYGGFLLPHVRTAADFSSSSRVRQSREIRGVFVGSPKPHKGLETMREAVAQVVARFPNVTLTITGDAPEDALPWENWVGTTTLRQGWQLVADADFTVLASTGAWSQSQFPVKLVDAMLGRTTCFVYDSRVTRWAAEDHAIIIDPSDPRDLASRIEDWISHGMSAQAHHVEAAHRRAVANFTPEAVAPHLARWLS